MDKTRLALIGQGVKINYIWIVLCIKIFLQVSSKAVFTSIFYTSVNKDGIRTCICSL